MNRASRVVQTRLAANRAVQPSLRQLRDVRYYRGAERDAREVTGRGRVGDPKQNGKRR